MMPQVRLLAPWTNADGEPFAAGEVIEASDDEARDLSARGAASLIEEEKKLEEQQATSAVYDTRMQRQDTADRAPQGKVQEQQAPTQPDPDPKPSEPRSKK